MRFLGDSDGLIFRNYSCGFYYSNNYHTISVPSVPRLFKSLPSSLTRNIAGDLVSLLHAGWHSAFSDMLWPA